VHALRTRARYPECDFRGKGDRKKGTTGKGRKTERIYFQMDMRKKINLSPFLSIGERVSFQKRGGRCSAGPVFVGLEG
jgi:hypothetical protein